MHANSMRDLDCQSSAVGLPIGVTCGAYHTASLLMSQLSLWMKIIEQLVVDDEPGVDEEKVNLQRVDGSRSAT